jgi:BASS family bile acid:Na+ symporter
MNIDEVRLHFDPHDVGLLNICLALIMFSVALELRREHFVALRQQPRAALVAWLSQTLLIPLLTLLFLYLAQPLPGIGLGLILVVCCPSGSVSNFMSLQAKGNAALAVSLTALFALLAPITLPLLFGLWSKCYLPAADLLRSVSVNSADMFRTTFWVMGLPLLLGILVAERYTVLAGQLSRFMRPLSLLILALFIIVALRANWSVFVPYAWQIALPVALLNAASMVLAYGFAQLFRLSEPDRRTITIESGIHNTGLSLALIFSFFDGLGSMALIAAWWGIWDLVAGMLLVQYWQRKGV